MISGILCIAGSDSNCASGITTDLSVIRDNRFYAFSAITAVTAQNNSSVLAVGSVTKELLADQLKSIVSSNKIIGVKIGLIPNNSILKVIHKFLKELRANENTAEIPVVWDPVASASSGGGLSELDFSKALKKLLPYVTVITPNLKEAATLADEIIDFSTLETYLASLNKLTSFFIQKGVKSVVIKGGHLSDYHGLMGREKFSWGCIDYLYSSNSEVPFYFIHKRVGSINGSNVRGTGCAFASALTCNLANGYEIEDAVTLAKTYITRGIIEAVISDNENNIKYLPLSIASRLKFQDFPMMCHSLSGFPVAHFNKEDDGFEKLESPLGFYVIVDSSKWVERLCKANVKTIQLRIKNPTSEAELEKEIKKSISLAKKYNVQLFINDYWELAIKHKAYGVHLGQGDITYDILISLKIAGLRLGISTHGFAEIARAAMIKPSYIALGHVFPTNSKVMPSKPQGLDRLEKYHQLLNGNIPTVAIGGIKLTNVVDVLKTGVDSVAVISAITAAENPEEEIKVWQHVLEHKSLPQTEA